MAPMTMLHGVRFHNSRLQGGSPAGFEEIAMFQERQLDKSNFQQIASKKNEDFSATIGKKKIMTTCMNLEEDSKLQ